LRLDRASERSLQSTSGLPVEAIMTREFLGKHPVVPGNSFIASSADVIGDVSLGEWASVWFHATVRGDVNWIRLGGMTNIQDHAVIHVTRGTGPTRLGCQVTVGHSAVVHGCTVCDRVLVGIGAVILDQAVVESDVIVGAGALVTPRTVIPAGTLALGRPARPVRDLRPEEIESIVLHALNYRHYAAMYLGLETPEQPLYSPDSES
jgi:gamma-carbonic anhydrase